MKHSRTNHPVSRQRGKQQNPSGRFSLLISFAPLAIIGTLLVAFLFAANQNSAVYALDEGNQIASNGAVGNFVWLDSNGNGLQDSGEPGVAGVSVTIFDTEDNEVATTITDSIGFYSFTGLEAGEYRVGFTLPANRSFTAYNTDNAGLPGPINSDVFTQTGSVGFTQPFSLGADENNPNVDAGLLPSCYSLDWTALGFETGNAGPQQFLNVGGSGVNMTINVRMYNAAFEDIGPYVHTSNAFPTITGNALTVRGISDTAYPQAGMIVSQITFSDPISLNGLWFEPFYFWASENLRKEMALQIFDTESNGILPGYFTTYDGSNLLGITHPTNNEPWLRSDFPNSQTDYSGAENINYGSQPIQEIHWYSWTTPPNGVGFSNTIGSSYFNGFTFCRVTPTAVSLIDLQSSNVPALPWVATLVAMVFMTGLLLVVRRREEVNG